MRSVPEGRRSGAGGSWHRSPKGGRRFSGAFSHVRNVVNNSVGGWDVAPITSHDPLSPMFCEPVLLQLVGSDGAGTHAVATLGDLIFDATEARALPLSRAALDRCVGAQLNGARFSHVARAVRLVPGKSVHTRMRRAERVRM